MKRDYSTILLVLILIAGLSLLLYPSFSNYWNSLHQSRVVDSYVASVADMDDDQFRALWDSAKAHNRALLERSNPYILTPELKEQYNQNLNLGGTGVMGYVEIPSIGVYLPVYHGTDETVLQVAVGHLEWTSLPTGGESTHCVVSGHRGLPTARLFTDLNKMVEGDIILLNVLDEVLTYQVDQIKIVEPYETEDLTIVEGKDYCTLVTCTPYGINSHRMLVRGIRIETAEEVKTVRVTADAFRIEPILIAPLVAAPMLLALLIVLMLPAKKKPDPEELNLQEGAE